MQSGVHIEKLSEELHCAFRPNIETAHKRHHKRGEPLRLTTGEWLWLRSKVSEKDAISRCCTLHLK
jgi:hypothetical protein